MTKALSPRTAPTDNNTKARDDVIRECATEFDRIAEARKDLSKMASETRKRLGDIGVQSKSFEYALRLRNMEQEARNSYMEDLHTTYKALGIEGQLDWISTLPAPIAGDAKAAAA